MSEIAISTNAAAVGVSMRTLGGRIPPAIRTRLGVILARLQRLVATEKITQAGILEPRSGNLRRALFTRIDDVSNGVQGVMGFDLAIAPYGRVQELGGVITAKHAANLAIPLEAMQTAKGVARAGAAEVIANPQAFGFSGTFVRPGGHVIFGKRPDGIVPLFALKKSVTLEARAPLASTIESQRDSIVQDLTDAVATATGGGQ